jgi:phage shock protein A
MTERRPRGFFVRLRSLLRGLASGWVRDHESRNPRAVYERAIAERTSQYAELKQAVAGILYMRNKLTAEIDERRAELARTHDDIRRSVQRGEDELATALITHRHAIVEDLERNEKELDDVRTEVDEAKSNLVKFRQEIRALEREKRHARARLATARARRRVQEAFDGLSLDSEMRALEQVREHIARVDTEGRLDTELGDTSLSSRVRAARHDAQREAAKSELEELKRRFRPAVLPAQETVIVAAAP